MRSFVYDALGRLTTEINPESGTASYVYDTATSKCTTAYPGELVQKADANGNAVCPSYDMMGRVVGMKYSGPNAGPSSYFVYDTAAYNGTAMANAKGHLAEAYTCTTCTPTPTKITDEYYSYNARGELTDVWESTPHSGGYYHTTAGYFPNHALASLTLPGSMANLTYTLDSKGRPYSVTANGGAVNLVGSASYNAEDEPLTVTLGLGDADSFLYDGAYRPTNFTYTAGSAGTNVAGMIGYNSGNGTMSSLQITDGFNGSASETCSYGYDDVLRLNNDNCGSVWSQTFSYDRYGNIAKSGSVTFSPGYSTATNRYNNFPYATYDNNGNLTDDGTNGCGGGPSGCYTYKYDANNALVSVTTSAGVTTITRDALGRTVEIDQPGNINWEILYSAVGKTAIMNGLSNAKSTFAVLPGGVELEALGGGGGGYLFHHKDWLGSSRFISSRSNRNMYFDTAYAPFGENYAPSGTADLDFTGHRQDIAAGLYDFQYRELNPNQGRWLSPDPLGIGAVDPSDPQSWNRYTYVLNDPCDAYDVLGLDPCKLALKFAGNLPKGVDPASVIAALNDAFGSQFSFSLASGTSSDFTISSDNDLSRFSTPGAAALGYAPANNSSIQLDGGAIAGEWNQLKGIVPPPNGGVGLAYLIGHEVGHKLGQGHTPGGTTAMAAVSDNIDGGAGGLAIQPFTKQQLNAIAAECSKYKKNPKTYKFGFGSSLASFWNQFYAWDNFVLGIRPGPTASVTIEQTIHVIY